MHSLNELQALVVRGLENLQLPSEPANLYQPVDYFFNLGGKRLRPVLTLMSAELFGLAPQECIDTALSVEVFHNFSLIHDDIMDQAPLRRGKETVHQKWNSNIAILSGDAVLVKAYELLSHADPAVLPVLLKAFNKMAFEVCEGQQMDMDFEKLEEVGESEYLRMIQLKTSVLIGTALQLGAISAKASRQDTLHIYDFGVQLGIAFQLQDDVLDLFGDPEKVGKQVGGDVLENKKTILLVSALKHANAADRAAVEDLLQTDRTLGDEKIQKAKVLYEKLGVRHATQELISTYTNNAYKSLEAVNLPIERKAGLFDFAKRLMQRES